jgi:hypothetical protein
MNRLKLLMLTAILGGFLFSLFGIVRTLDPAMLPTPTNTNLEQAPELILPQKITPTFHPTNLLWEEITSSAPWAPRDSGETFVFQNKIWLIGGLNGNNHVKENHLVEYWNTPHFNDTWNTEDGIHWQKINARNPWGPRRSMTVAFFNNKLWMLGGWNPQNGYVNDIWTSSDGINWKREVEHAEWPAREGHTLEVFQNKLWLIGGVNYNEKQTKNDVWYSEDGLHWTEVKNIPWKPRWDHATEVFNNKIFLTGGMNLAGETFNDVWVSSDGLTWTLLTDNPAWQSRQGHALIAYKDYLWLIGRLNDEEAGGINDVWFSKDGLTWVKTEKDPEWTGREDFFSTIFNNRIWIFGGMDANWQWRNDVWASRDIIE